jgi:hypothetical protein
MRLKRMVARRLWALLVVCLGAAFMTAAVLSAQPQETAEPRHAFHLSAKQRRKRDRSDALKRRGAQAVPKLARTHAVAQMSTMPALATSGKWTFNGPDSITNGQALSAAGFCGTPNRVTVSGRVTSVAFGASPSTIYVGSASGGVWKTVDGGSTWTPLTDQQVSLAVGALAVVPGTPDTIYVGTGEGNLSCDSEFGQGILKSTDGGASWVQLAADTFDRLTFTKIAVDPSNPTVLYAATTIGRSNGAAAECVGVTTGTPGIYKSIDSGVSKLGSRATRKQMVGSGVFGLKCGRDLWGEPSNYRLSLSEIIG